MARSLSLQRRFVFIYKQVRAMCSLPNFRTEQFSNDYISSLCKQTLYREALEAFDFIQKNTRFLLRPSTYANLILACSSLRSIEQGRKIHDHILKSNYQPDMILCNHILNMYGKCGSLKDARKVFDDMPQRNVVSYTSVIAAFSQNGLDIDAIELYLEMLRSALIPDQFTFGSIIKACAGFGDIGLGKQLHGHVIKTEAGSGPIAQNALIAMYTKFNQISNAWTVFSRIAVKDLISWGSIISGFSQLGYEFEALSHFREMLSHGVFQPNEFILGSVLSACSNLIQPEYGRQIHGLCLKTDLGGDIYAGCSLCDMYARCGFLDSAKEVFYQIRKPDVVSWNAIITGVANTANINEAMSYFTQLRFSGLIPDAITLGSLLSGCTGPWALSQGMQVHSYIIKTGFQSHLSVNNSLLCMYANCSDLSTAFNVFDEMRNNANLVSWNTILMACLQHRQSAEIFRLFKLMLFSGNKPDPITIGNVLGACVEISSIEMGNQIHCNNLKTGLVLDLFVTNGLIDMYAKCGSLGCARRLFCSLENPDVVSWSSLIVGYAQFGYGEEALKLFDEMKESGVNPNHVTFLGVLTACSHVGLVEDGLKLYRTMQTEHKVSPTKEHSSCVVDLLGRAGRLKEAEDFIHEMGFDPDVIIWKTLLGACKIHGNVDKAKRAAENILKIDPSNSTAHVLLCNIHASSGNWDNVASLRTLMKQRDVRKVPGQSWIEVKDKIHSFFSEDVLHPERGEIYGVLEELWLQMLDDGNVPFRRKLQVSQLAG